MIIREYHSTRKDGVVLYRTYSDKGLYIKQQPTGNIYAEAIDIADAPYTYEETDQPIEVEGEQEQEQEENVKPQNDEQNETD